MDLELKNNGPNALSEWVKPEFSDSLPSILGHFFAHVKMRSEKTFESYQRELKIFFQWLESRQIKVTQIEEINHKIVDAFVNDAFNEGKVKTSTIWHRVAVVSSLFEFCLDRRYTEAPNPVKQLRRPKSALKPTSPTMPLPEGEIKKILGYLNSKVVETRAYTYSMAHRSAILRRLLFRMLLSVGMRADELAGLKMSGVQRVGDRLQLKLLLKGKKPHQVIVPKNLAGELERYRLTFRTEAATDEPFLVAAKYMGFWHKAPPELSAGVISKSITDICQKAGVHQKVTAHSIRATTASLLWQQGQSIHKIQKLLGHSNPRTTWLYISRFVDVTESNALDIGT